MPRPKKERHCQCRNRGQVYKPAGKPMFELDQIPIFSDELEVLRLCDMEGMVQEDAGLKMGVSRGTVQRLLASARKKTARALVEGAALVFAEEKD